MVNITFTTPWLINGLNLEVFEDNFNPIGWWIKTPVKVAYMKCILVQTNGSLVKLSKVNFFNGHHHKDFPGEHCRRSKSSSLIPLRLGVKPTVGDSNIINHEDTPLIYRYLPADCFDKALIYCLMCSFSWMEIRRERHTLISLNITGDS